MRENHGSIVNHPGLGRWQFWKGGTMLDAGTLAEMRATHPEAFVMERRAPGRPTNAEYTAQLHAEIAALRLYPVPA